MISDTLNDEESSYLPWLPILGCLLLFLLFLPIAYFSGSCVMVQGVRSWILKYSFDPILYFLMFWVPIHIMLAWPIATWSYRQIGQFKHKALRILTVTALMVPPVLSYIYYRNGIQTMADVRELVSVLVPAAIVAACFFELTRKTWVLSLVFVIPTFTYAFIINDAMLSLPTWRAYACESGSMPYLKAAFNGMAMIAALVFTLRRKAG